MSQPVVGNHDRCSLCGYTHERYNGYRGGLSSRGNDTYRAGVGPIGSEHDRGEEAYSVTPESVVRCGVARYRQSVL